MIKYKIKGYKGTVGDFATEWWTDEDWRKHKEHVEDLKSKGEYLEEYEIELSLEEDPMYDNIQTKPTESYRMEFINFE